ncbi:4Fe-4S ferredoxin iron-sulfur binding domain-containing protein [Flexistipes sinusarabici DSM 4947]|uniref:4Fe-4S ferredoxin iron-sulfur binding domain-containing protein n=1 Tax=Flexistipes sinusarabici (strain ATCC 49648 / DSM 4947 / MAS 10) TaxID=717231 RepID=F8E632_FLESM|nr:4Fe-4S binding protein [Flexistipes sinusarabici]AEI14740.1 4Fe-4S ferredoxin iron-sulfur binding domain-containing protein [Flexistipes sinusarabici DSM 4947]
MSIFFDSLIIITTLDLFNKELMVSIRKIIQTIFFIYTIFAGIWFYVYINELKNENYSILKPSSVEGFLPISALLGLKRFLLTGTYDPVHPAGLTILIAAIVMSIFVKKSFCSHICPVGFLSELISNAGFRFTINRWISGFLGSVKYILLLFFLYVIFYQMSLQQIIFFQNSPYNKIADAKMLYFFLDISTTGFIVIISLILLTYLFKNFWCRFLCPYGALLGILSWLSPFKIKREKANCIDCQKCREACPSDIKVYNKENIFAVNCIGCRECAQNETAVKQHCLRMINKDRYFEKNENLLSIAATLIFLLIFIAAYFTGHWNSPVSNEEYARFLDSIRSLSHP